MVGGNKLGMEVKKMTEVYKITKLLTFCFFLILIIIIGIYTYKLFSFDTISNENIIETFQVNKTIFVNAKSWILKDPYIDEVFDDSYDKENEPLSQIFDILKYRSIHKVNGSMVYFVRVSEFGFTQGIVFTETGNEPTGPYVTETTKIDENWFIFKFK